MVGHACRHRRAIAQPTFVGTRRLTKMVLRPLDRALPPGFAERRGENDSGRNDITQLLLDTRMRTENPAGQRDPRRTGHAAAGRPRNDDQRRRGTFRNAPPGIRTYADAREAVQAGNDNYPTPCSTSRCGPGPWYRPPPDADGAVAVR